MNAEFQTLDIAAYYDCDRKPKTLTKLYIFRKIDGSLVREISVEPGTSEEVALAEARRVADELEGGAS